MSSSLKVTPLVEESMFVMIRDKMKLYPGADRQKRAEVVLAQFFPEYLAGFQVYWRAVSSS